MQMLNMVLYTLSEVKEKEKECRCPWGWSRTWLMCSTVIFPTCKLMMPMCSQERCPHKTFHWWSSSYRDQTWCCHPHNRGQKSPSTKLNIVTFFFFLSAIILFSVIFPNIDHQESGIPTNQNIRHCKMQTGFTLPGPNPGQRWGESLTLTRCVQ